MNEINTDEFPILKQYYHVTMHDGSVWSVPISDIAMNRAEYYMEVDGTDFMEALVDSLREFQEDFSLVQDWAVGNMNWSDVISCASMVHPPNSSGRYDKDWVNPQKWEIR